MPAPLCGAAGQKKNRAYTQATLSPRTSRTPSLDRHQWSGSYCGSGTEMMPTVIFEPKAFYCPLKN